MEIRIQEYSQSYQNKGNLPGSLGYEDVDVQMLVDWEIDYFKARFLKINVNLRKTNSSMTTAIPEKMEELTQELASTLTLQSKMFFQIIYHSFIHKPLQIGREFS